MNVVLPEQIIDTKFNSGDRVWFKDVHTTAREIATVIGIFVYNNTQLIKIGDINQLLPRHVICYLVVLDRPPVYGQDRFDRRAVYGEVNEDELTLVKNDDSLSQPNS